MGLMNFLETKVDGEQHRTIRHIVTWVGIIFAAGIFAFIVSL